VLPCYMYFPIPRLAGCTTEVRCLFSPVCPPTNLPRQPNSFDSCHVHGMPRWPDSFACVLPASRHYICTARSGSSWYRSLLNIMTGNGLMNGRWLLVLPRLHPVQSWKVRERARKETTIQHLGTATAKLQLFHYLPTTTCASLPLQMQVSFILVSCIIPLIHSFVFPHHVFSRKKVFTDCPPALTLPTYA